jgi:hypothetical protein
MGGGHRVGWTSLPLPPPAKSSESNVGRASFSLRALTLLVTALMAGPWNIVLSAAESSQVDGQVRALGVRPPGSPRVQRMVHFGCRDHQSCSVIAPDYDSDEEEGNQGGPWSLATALASVLVSVKASGPGWLLVVPSHPVRTVVREHLCPLRC